MDPGDSWSAAAGAGAATSATTTGIARRNASDSVFMIGAPS
jgi:hypothetical protein